MASKHNVPSFIICGVKKAATTSLYEYLKQHPKVFMTELKETNFFAYEPHNHHFANADMHKFPVRLWDDYRGLFADIGSASAFGEASPVYINSDYACEQIATLLPEVKLIFSLRHPITRIYSIYLMDLRNGLEQRSFEEKIASDWDYLRSTTYFSLLKKWYAKFGPERIKVVLFEDIIREPIAEIQEIYRFIVDPDFIPDVSVTHNRVEFPRIVTFNML